MDGWMDGWMDEGMHRDMRRDVSCAHIVETGVHSDLRHGEGEVCHPAVL